MAMAMAMAAAPQLTNLDGKVGSYAISTIGIDSWMNEPINNLSSRSRNNKNKTVREIIHPLFNECSKIILDPFWIDKFNLGSMGKFPRGFSYHDGILTYRKGSKSISIDLPNSPVEASHMIMDFFKIHGGIFSPMDQQTSLNINDQEDTAKNNNDQPITWNDINNKMQECLLSNYFTEMQKIMNLSQSETNNLRQVVKLGITNKYFGKYNILLDKTRISSINGLLWNNEQRYFFIDSELKPMAVRTYSRNKDALPVIDPNQKDMVPQFYIKWVKYLESLNKKVQMNNRKIRRIHINNPNETIKHSHILSNSHSTFTTITSPESINQISSSSSNTDYDYDDDDDEEDDDDDDDNEDI